VLLLLSAVALLQDPLAVRADSVRPRHDALAYDVTLVLPDTGATIHATVVTRWRLASSEPIRIDLDTVFTVSRVMLDGRAAEWRRAGYQIYVTTGGRAGVEARTEIEYEGVPGDGLVIRGAGVTRTMFADNWPDRARKWLASQDHPGDKAPVTWTITAPAELTVIATGVLSRVEPAAGSRRTWHFTLAEPTPVHTMVIGAARLATTPMGEGGCPDRCVPVSVVSYPADSAWAVAGPFKRSAEMVSLFTRLFGTFPYGELRHVESSTIFGGMENSTAIFYSDKAWSAHNMGEGVVAHETAHQWFGDAVSQSDWHHVWLSEGFATYGGALWTEHIRGTAGLRAEMQDNARTVRAAAVRNRPILDTAETRLMALLNANSYPKGSWVLHSLRGLMGDSAFFRGLRAYYAQYRNGNALSRDFANVMSAAVGRSLDWYFTQALTQPGFPVFAVRTGIRGDSVTVELEQVQDAAWGLYRLPGLVLDLGGRRATVNVEDKITQATFGRPSAWNGRVTLDPETWWLLDVREPQP
jgi:aminopeptidase N